VDLKKLPPGAVPPPRTPKACAKRAGLPTRLVVLSVLCTGTLVCVLAAVLVSPERTHQWPDARTPTADASTLRPSSREDRVTEDPRPSAPGPTRASADRLRAIRAKAEQDLTDYAERRKELASFVEECGGTVEAEEAAQLLAALDTSYAAVAENALADALKRAADLASGGEFDRAIAAINAVRSRFADGPWLATAGESQIKEAIDEIVRLNTTATPRARQGDGQGAQQTEPAHARRELSP
jgi:hypothetical protein